MEQTNWVIDLDGVMWLGDTPIDGSAAAVDRLLESGRNVLFVTNMSRLTLRDQTAKLARCGLSQPVRVITSAVAAASLLETGGRVLVCGGEGIVEAVSARGAEAVSVFSPECEEAGEPYDAVVVGMDSRFDYAACGRAMRAVRAGARLIGTNHDPTFPTPGGLEAGGGAVLAAVAAAAETEAVMAGKPHAPMRDCVIAELSGASGVSGSAGSSEASGAAGAAGAAALAAEGALRDGILVGDRPDSDGLFAKALGLPFALVLSGVTPEGDASASEAAFVSLDLASLVEKLLG